MPWIKIVKGPVPDTLSDNAPAAVSFLHLDMNSPAAEFAALEILFDRMPPGGIVVLDDYGWILHSKQREAADRFVQARSHHVLELPTGQGLIVKKS
jgi:O-methyltransferase